MMDGHNSIRRLIDDGHSLYRELSVTYLPTVDFGRPHHFLRYQHKRKN